MKERERRAKDPTQAARVIHLVDNGPSAIVSADKGRFASQKGKSRGWQVNEVT